MIVKLFELVLLSLILGIATFRLSVLITKEDGPLFILKNLRNAISARAFGGGNKAFVSLALLVTCPYCIGVWVAFFLTMLYSILEYPLNPLEWVLVTLAASGVQYVLQNFVGRS